jgi:hypothetical protein
MSLRFQRRNEKRFVSYSVEEFNRREREAERAALLARVGAISGMISGINDFKAEYRILSGLVAVAGYLNWYVISGHYVELSRHTEIGKSMTRVVMDRIGSRSTQASV